MNPQEYEIWATSEAYSQRVEALSASIEDGLLVFRDETGIVFATKTWEMVRVVKPQQKDSDS